MKDVFKYIHCININNSKVEISMSNNKQFIK